MEGLINWEDSVDAVEATEGYSLPDPEKIGKFLTQLLKPYKYILAIGISGTGKSSTLDHYKGRPNGSLTRWNRDLIWDMIDNSGAREDSMWGDLDNLERSIFPKILMKPESQLIVENWGRTRHGRKKYYELMHKGLGNTLCLVFDGPIDLIIERNIQVGNHIKFGKSEDDLRMYLKDLYNGFKWPTFGEGWTSIIYLNTFGKDGEDYLSRRLR